MAREQFGDMVKAVLDVEQALMAIGEELQSDEEAVLLDQGSRQTARRERTQEIVRRLGRA